MAASSASACLALPPAPAPVLGAPDGMAVGDFEVHLSGPRAGLWCRGDRLGAPLLCWPCFVQMDGAEGGGWLLRHPGSASLLCVGVRELMSFGPGWLASRLLAHGYAFEAPVRARTVSGYVWQCWFQHIAATPQGVLPAGSPEACQALKLPVWRQEVAHG